MLTGVMLDESLWGLWCRQVSAMSGLGTPRVRAWVCEKNNLGDKIEMLRGGS